MTPWIVDSCILLDVALNDPRWGVPSATLLQQCGIDGLAVCPVSAVEIAPAFGGRFDAVRQFLALLGIRDTGHWMEADTRTAAAGWNRYVAAKRSGASVRRPIADLLIGAHATRFRGLLTRNAPDFLPWFPALTVRTPRA